MRREIKALEIKCVSEGISGRTSHGVYKMYGKATKCLNLLIGHVSL